MDDLRPGDPKKIGKYTLKGRLGEGSMGLVYQGYDPVERRYVAIKVMRDYNSPLISLDRFRHEVDAAKLVQSPRVAGIIDSDFSSPMPWYACQFVAGPNLTQGVRIGGGGLPYRGVEVLARGLYLAVEAIHAQKIVHRDLKPDNIILSEYGPVVIDLGISYMGDRTRLTQQGFAIGTLPYACPEQIRNIGEPKPGWDFFAYGGVLMFALTGRSPFQRDNDVAIMHAILRDPPPNLREYPARFRNLILPCLEKEPRNRPSLSEIRALLPGDPMEEVRGTKWLPPAVEEVVLAETKRFPVPAPAPKPTPRPKFIPSTPRPARVSSPQSVAKPQPKPAVVSASKPAPRPVPPEPRPTPRTVVQKPRSRLRPAVIYSLALLLVGLIGGGAIVWRYQPEIAKVYNKFKENAQKAAQPPSASQNPSPKPSPKLSPLPPKPSFVVGKLGKTYNRSTPSAALTVTKAEINGYDLHLRVSVSGFGKNTAKALDKACVKIQVNNDTQYTQRVNNKWWEDSKSTATTNRRGSLIFNLHTPGSYTLMLECGNDAVVEAPIGRNTIKRVGQLENGSSIIEVSDVKRIGRDVLVIVPNFEKLTVTSMCVRSPQGSLIKSSRLKKEKVEETTFHYVTFPNVITGSKLYVSCSVKNAKPVFSGTPMTLP